MNELEKADNVVHLAREEYRDTLEIMRDPKTMDALRKSDRDIKEGRVKKVSSVEELLADM